MIRTYEQYNSENAEQISPRYRRQFTQDLQGIMNANTTTVAYLKQLLEEYESTQELVEGTVRGAINHHPNDSARATTRTSEQTFMKDAISLIENKLKVEERYKKYAELYGPITANLVRNEVNTFVRDGRPFRDFSSPENISRANNILHNLTHKNVSEILKDPAGTLILPHIGEIEKNITLDKFHDFSLYQKLVMNPLSAIHQLLTPREVGVESLTKLLIDNTHSIQNFKEIKHIVDHLDLLRPEVAEKIGNDLNEYLENNKVPRATQILCEIEILQKLPKNEQERGRD